ncbi:MAG: hypothetical protein P1U39_07450 [Legionellaceae bacterium]|nr:hypothetical protein [Legionellaceae bacterium]
MKFILITHPDFMGDNNQLRGIQSELKNKQIPHARFIEVDAALFDSNTLDEDTCVLVSGRHGLIKSDEIKRTHPDIKVMWSGHQYFDELSSVRCLPDGVALPKTAITEQQQAALDDKTQLVLTTGVAHCVNVSTVADDHARFQSQPLPAHAEFSNQIGIVLAGDAPTPEGEIQCFTPSDAREQAVNMARFIQTHGLDTPHTAIMLTNGPRTGQHNPATGELHTPSPHRSGQRDQSTEAFIQQIQDILEHATLFVYDFQFDDLKTGPSAYKPMMKQVADSQQGLWFVPSESTSMVTESSFFLLSNTPVIIYHPPSANAQHRAHAEEAIQQGVAVTLDDALHQHRVHQPSRSQHTPAAHMIANAIYQQLCLNPDTRPTDVRGTLFHGENNQLDRCISPDRYETPCGL